MEITELKSKAFKASFWSFIERFSIQIMQFGISVVLARLLSPKDFGLIVLAMLFSGISAAISDAGFEKLIIQQKELSSLQIDTIFFINIILGTLLTVLLITLTPVIASYFEEPRLTPILRWISLSIFFNALSQTQRTLLMKHLNFKKISISQIVSSVSGGIVGITLAILGYGVWALVFSMLTAQLILLMLFWIKSSWYPTLSFSYPSIRKLLPSGLNILFSSILFFFIQQFSNFIIGKNFSGKQLGLVNRGSKTPEIITSVIQSVILKIALPVLSHVQDDTSLFKNGLKKLVQTIAFIAFPLLFLLLANAKDITVFLFTAKWSESIIYLQIFCLVKLFDPFVSLFREVIVAKGFAKLLSNILIITSVVEIASLLFAIQFGLKMLLVALVFSMIFQYFFYLAILSRRFNLSIRDNLNWIAPFLLLSIIASSTCLIFDGLFASRIPFLILRLVLKGIIAGITYILGLYLLKLNESAYFRLKNNPLLKMTLKM